MCDRSGYGARVEISACQTDAANALALAASDWAIAFYRTGMTQYKCDR